MKKLLFILAIVSNFPIDSALANIQFDQLEYSKRIDSETNNLVFVPYKNSNLGNIFFKSYQIVKTPPRGSGEVRNIYVDLLKSVSVNELRKFRSKLYDLGFKSEEKTPLNALESCQITENVLQYFAKYQAEAFMPSISFKSDQGLCSTKITYLVEDEKDVLDLLKDAPIKVTKNIPLCSVDSPKTYFWESELMTQLIEEKIIEKSGNEWVADAWGLLYRSIKLSIDFPDMFGGQISEDGWNKFRDRFLWDFTKNSAKLDLAQSDLVQYQCIPDPLVIEVQ